MSRTAERFVKVMLELKKLDRDAYEDMMREVRRTVAEKQRTEYRGKLKRRVFKIAPLVEVVMDYGYAVDERWLEGVVGDLRACYARGLARQHERFMGTPEFARRKVKP